jgi:hypothetical protein
VEAQPRAGSLPAPAPARATGREGQRAQAVGQDAIGAQDDEGAPRQRQRCDQRREQPAQAQAEQRMGAQPA